VFWKLDYSVNDLFALPVVSMTIRRPDGAERSADVAARMTPDKRVLRLATDIRELIIREQNVEHLNRQRWADLGEAAMVWKMPQFDISEDEVDRLIHKARDCSALIVDLRGNPGGYETALQAMTGDVMDHDVTIATGSARKPSQKPILAKSRKSSAFHGKLVVLIDARSASAAELFARVIQLEHRGIVVGDRSSGFVMESRYYPLSQGYENQVAYGVSITDADLVMSDGKSLEHSGVTPDVMAIPTAADLAAGRDPALARAAELVGMNLDSARAGKMFPVEWLPE
jgi:C-terminal processing protease CtpA/Prc